MQAIFDACLTRRETGRFGCRRGRRDAVDFTRRVIMRANLDMFVIIGNADTDEEAGVLFFIGRLRFAFCVKDIAEAYSIGTLVLIPLDPK